MPVLVMLACGSQVSGAVARVFSFLGLMSYGVYVLHVPLFAALGVAASMVHVQLPEGPVLALLVAVLAGLCAWAGHYLYDQPLRKWLSGKARRGKTQKRCGKSWLTQAGSTGMALAPPAGKRFRSAPPPAGP